MLVLTNSAERRKAGRHQQHVALADQAGDRVRGPDLLPHGFGADALACGGVVVGPHVHPLMQATAFRKSPAKPTRNRCNSCARMAASLTARARSSNRSARSVSTVGFRPPDVIARLHRSSRRAAKSRIYKYRRYYKLRSSCRNVRANHSAAQSALADDEAVR